jgi:hypothetical protein
MTDLDAILSRIDFTEPMGTSDFLKLLLFTDSNNDTYYLDNLRADFKFRFVDPLLGKLQTLYQNISKETDKTSTPENIKKMADPMGLNSLSKEYSKKTKVVSEKAFKKYEKQMESIFALNLPKVGFIPPQPPKLPEQLKNSPPLKDKKEPVKDQKTVTEKELFYKEFTKKLNGAFDPIIRKLENVKIEPVKKETQKPEKVVSKEQKTLQQKNEVTLSRESLDQIQTIIKKDFSEPYKELFKNLKLLKSGNINVENSGSGGGLSTLVKTVAGLALLGTGIGALVTTVFWPKLHSYIEEKFGKKASDIFSRFEGIVKGIGKFFTMGGVSFGLKKLNLAGKMMSTVGEFLEGVIDDVFKGLVKGPIGKAVFGTTATVGKFLSGGTVMKILGKGISKIAGVGLRGVPILGSLISLYYAYQRFTKENDTIGGLIDIVSAIGGFLPPPFGTILSLGASALNAVLDFQAGDGGGNKTQAKLKIMGDWFGSLYKFILDKTPLGWVINFGKGFYAFANGMVSNNPSDALNALKSIEDVPLFGMGASFLRPLLELSTITTESGEKKIDYKKFIGEYKKNIFNGIMKMVPNTFGLKKLLAEHMGIPYTDVESDSDFSTRVDKNLTEGKPINDDKIQYSSEIAKKQQDAIAAKELELKRKKEDFEKSKIGDPFDDESKKLETEVKAMEELLRGMKNKYENYQQYMSPEDEKKRFLGGRKVENKNDFFYNPNDNSSSIILDPNSNKQYNLSPQDNVVAFKRDGDFHKTLKGIEKLVGVMNSNLLVLGNTLEKLNNPTNNITNLTQNTNNGSSDVSFNSGRDSIYNSRLEWWKISANERTA